MYKKGFGLLELLIVIVIITILGALLYPSLTATKEASKRSADASQLQQLLKTYTMYVGDHEGQVPYATYVSRTGRTNRSINLEVGLPPTQRNYVTWVTFLYPYLKSKEIFWSPASSVNQNHFIEKNKFNIDRFVCRPSWGYNGCYFSTGNALPTAIALSNPINECIIEEPSSTLVFAGSTNREDPSSTLYKQNPKEGELGHYLVFPPSCSDEWQAKKDAPSPNPVYSNHFGHLYPRFNNKTICNVGFADGHVKGISIKDLRDSKERIWQVKKGTSWDKN